jgi:two-component system, chemotaxis family, response regulator Rcp1
MGIVADARARAVDVILVEDHMADMRLTVEAIKEGAINCNLHWVKDGVEACEFLNQSGPPGEKPRPDLILLDLNLPRMDGRELRATLKSDSRRRQIPVLVLTTSRAEDDIRRTYDLHANCYISKRPLDFDGLVDVFRSINSADRRYAAPEAGRLNA